MLAIAWCSGRATEYRISNARLDAPAAASIALAFAGSNAKVSFLAASYAGELLAHGSASGAVRPCITLWTIRLRSIAYARAWRTSLRSNGACVVLKKNDRNTLGFLLTMTL